MDEPEHLDTKGVLLDPPVHARCGHSEIAIQEVSSSTLTATHFDRIYIGQNRVLSIPTEDAPLILPCRVARSRVTDWRDKKTGRCLYRTVFEFTDLSAEVQLALERFVSGVVKSTTNP